ncbi:bifunctional hydroxymethylpyrimidine kinase/phosphomethylpyrimidine kinase [Dehalococcoidia bacterium]|nr:bifunctional hydroxymethylpyrimidine kinase/phosphomethylpyrimidine kinase [Dehalococcoidia bacterium]
MPRVMTIAGSDSGAGAGIQADLKTFAALGVYGTSVLTAITAQNTQRVTAVLELPVDLIQAQIDSVLSDIGTDVVKTGMLSSAAIIKVVADKLKEYEIKELVVDPVMVAKGGDRLLQEEATETLRSTLIPLAKVVTPNRYEAEVIVGHEVKDLDDARDAAKEIVDMGANVVVVKGGHIDGPATDILFDGKEFRAFTAPRLVTTNTHGTGCTFASATAAGLAKGMSIRESVGAAKKYITEAIRNAFPMGHGHGPLNHFYEEWERTIA